MMHIGIIVTEDDESERDGAERQQHWITGVLVVVMTTLSLYCIFAP